MATSTFSWASLADVGLGALQGLFNSSTSRAVARAENRVRDAQNMARASRNSLAATIKGINDQRTMANAARNYNAAATNASRMADAFLRGDFEAVIQGAEYNGAIAARGAASGAAGISNRAAEFSAALKVGRAQEQRKTAQGKALYDAQLQASGIMDNAFMSLDRSRNYMQMDQRVSYGQSAFSGLLGGILGKKDSLHTFLGSLDSTNLPTGVTVMPVETPKAIGTDLGTLAAESGATGATAYPVENRWVTGQPLQSMPVIQFKSQVRF